MREPILSIQPDEWMGLAWFVKDRGGVRFVEHGGTTNGQCALAFARARARLRDRGARQPSARPRPDRSRVGARFDDVLGVAPWHRRRVELGAESALAEYAGRYEMPLNELELPARGRRLVLDLIPKGGFPKPDSPPRPAPAAGAGCVPRPGRVPRHRGRDEEQSRRVPPATAIWVRAPHPDPGFASVRSRESTSAAGAAAAFSCRVSRRSVSGARGRACPARRRRASRSVPAGRRRGSRPARAVRRWPRSRGRHSSGSSRSRPSRRGRRERRGAPARCLGLALPAVT